MLLSDIFGFALFIGYYIVVVAVIPMTVRTCFRAPFEVVRKMHHVAYTMSIFPLVKFFSSWYAAVLAAATLVLMAYPALIWAERLPFYKRIFVEREPGDFKRQLLIAQSSLAILIFVFWGLLGEKWQYVAVIGAMAWGFGDAAAALVGKAFGRHHVRNRYVERSKTIEGTLSMVAVTLVAVFFTLLAYAGQSWYVSLAVAAFVAPLCSVVELFSRRGMDSLTVPLSAAIPAFGLLYLFRSLGL
ncbi:MAG: phosphatidate cytidylyltransferase [Bacillota bacterium]